MNDITLVQIIEIYLKDLLDEHFSTEDYRLEYMDSYNAVGEDVDDLSVFVIFSTDPEITLQVYIDSDSRTVSFSIESYGKPQGGTMPHIEIDGKDLEIDHPTFIDDFKKEVETLLTKANLI